MTSWQDPPLTRREARQRERLAEAEASAQGSRRAGTTEPTAAGDEPRLTRPTPPRYGAGFNHSITVQPDGTAEAPAELRATPADSSATSAPAGSAEGTSSAETTRPPAAPADELTERTLTRRQLRAMLQAQEAARLANSGEAPQDAAAPDAPAPAESGAEDVPMDGGPVIEAQIIEPEIVEPEIVEPESVEPEAGNAAAEAQSPTFAPIVVPEHPQAQAPVPVDHGSTDVVDPDARHHDSAGSGSAASALILPVIPTAPDATGPLTRTGEVLVTGSIDLPRSLGATGQHPNRFDSADMDHMFDSETDPNTSTVEPISASRAISTHASTREMITPAQKRGSHLPVILAVTASVLLIGVIALVVAGFVFGVF